MPPPRLRQRPTTDAVPLLKPETLDQQHARNRTICFDELPAWRQDNPAVVTGYREGVENWQACLSTIWWWHNETVNIWTHLLGGLASMSLAVYIIYKAIADHNPDLAQTVSWSTPFTGVLTSVNWQDGVAFGVFFFGCIVCFFCSTVFHTSLCHREDVVRWTSRMDFLGILTLGTFNFFPTFHYGFYCDPVFRTIYPSLMAVSGFGIYLVCAPTYSSPSYRRMRAVTFVSLGLVAVFPFAHAMVRYGLHEARQNMALGWIAIEIIAYLTGVLLYAERCPECIFPGRFDLVGASHQLFHICSLLAVTFHYIATVKAFQYRHIVHAGTCTA
ncbi:hypothetical protein PHLGIDRAFT_105796 [Phlebiopsis gigantea 11061_1 CR5-6]|uniref:Uncharacterized protein n=1 Tax=Phlebiopsis gigantea (strain 11061_1 CR5-6) TaxID=745531 RepID=A0A0C3NQB8_PHLG1|nr:hypothetical protein PHLGIDRAFT_105796 [Phlebiopsis gigantea 11061_1 CR5-6]